MRDTLTMPFYPRSFFVGATSWWQHRERRRALRWVTAIITRGNTEPHELMFYVLFMGIGLHRVAVYGLGHQPLDGWAFGIITAVGLAGLARRSYNLRAAAAFGGAVLRFYGFLYYLSIDPAGDVWCNYAMATVMLSWIFLRLVCRRAMQTAVATRNENDA
jgi:hypothetical protein